MSKVLITEEYLLDIADAIREKLGVMTEYKPSEMAAAIESIPTGSGGTYHLDNKKVAQASPAEYITTPLDVPMVAGMWYQITLRDGDDVETQGVQWNGDTTYRFDSVDRGDLRVTETTAGLTYYGGSYRDIYCDIISIGEIY